jgi:hypothetical protein
MIEAAQRIADANADIVALCRTGPDIDAAIASGHIALVLAQEGCPQIDTDIELLETFARLGVRVVSFTHFGRTSARRRPGTGPGGGRGGPGPVRCQNSCRMVDLGFILAPRVLPSPVSDLCPGAGMAGVADPQRFIQGRGNSGVAA